MQRHLTTSGFRFWISDLMSSVFFVPLCETIKDNDRTAVTNALGEATHYSLLNSAEQKSRRK